MYRNERSPSILAGFVAHDRAARYTPTDGNVR